MGAGQDAQGSPFTSEQADPLDEEPLEDEEALEDEETLEEVGASEEEVPNTETPEQSQEEAEPETPHAPAAFAFAVPESMYSQEEIDWLLQAQDNPDPSVRFQARQFEYQRQQQYFAQGAIATQLQVQTLPQPFVARFGVYVQEYLNQAKPADRAKKETLDAAKIWAVGRRILVEGEDVATVLREAADLLDTPGQRPARGTARPSPVAVRPEERSPVSVVSGGPVGLPRGNRRTRDAMARNRILNGLGISEDDD